MNYRSLNFGGEQNWTKNQWKGLQVETSLKIQMIFLSFVKMCRSKKWTYCIHKLSNDDKISSIY